MGERWSNDGGEGCVTRIEPGCLAAREMKKSTPNMATSLYEKGKNEQGVKNRRQLYLGSCYRVAKSGE
jgi:hypothetical protein